MRLSTVVLDQYEVKTVLKAKIVLPDVSHDAVPERCVSIFKSRRPGPCYSKTTCPKIPVDAMSSSFYPRGYFTTLGSGDVT